MDENRISGTAKNIGGKIEEGFAGVTGDIKTQASGAAKQVSGAAQDMYGHARDIASDAVGTARLRGRHKKAIIQAPPGLHEDRAQLSSRNLRRRNLRNHCSLLG